MLATWVETLYSPNQIQQRERTTVIPIEHADEVNKLLT